MKCQTETQVITRNKIYHWCCWRSWFAKSTQWCYWKIRRSIMYIVLDMSKCVHKYWPALYCFILFNNFVCYDAWSHQRKYEIVKTNSTPCKCFQHQWNCTPHLSHTKSLYILRWDISMTYNVSLILTTSLAISPEPLVRVCSFSNRDQNKIHRLLK